MAPDHKKKRAEEYSLELNQNSILRMTDEKTLQLIELYKQEECLWNTKIDDYKNKEIRSKSAMKIARILNLPHFEARHVMIKFKNLRNSYCQELKKIANSISLGTQDVYKPRVFWFPTMDSFLRPHLQPSRNHDKNAVIQVEQCKREVEDKEEEWLVQLSNPEDVLYPDNSLDSEQFPNEEEELNNRKTTKNLLSNLKRKLERSDTDKEDYVEKSLREISQTMHSIRQQDDYYENFGKYIASLLRDLPKLRAFKLQAKIVSLITEESCSSELIVSQSDET